MPGRMLPQVSISSSTSTLGSSPTLQQGWRSTSYSDFVNASRPEDFPQSVISDEEKEEHALERAKRKVREKGAHYERDRSGAGNVFGDTKSLDPAELRHILRFIFGVTLTDAEHVALVKHFDRDGDGTIDNAEFQSAFFRLADEGKDEFKRAQRIRGARLQAQKQRLEIRLHKSLTERNKTHLANYTQKESEQVQDRMAKVASLYDAARDGVGPGLAVFEGELNPTQFREQLRRSLDFKMSDAEFSALFEVTDRDKSGTVEGAEFKFKFLRLRRKGILKARQELAKSNDRISARIKKLEGACLERFNTEYRAKVSYDFTPQDKKNAFDRIAHAAAYWTDELHPDFQSQLDATKLEQQLMRSFGIRLTPPELGAVLTTIPQIVCNDPDKIRPGQINAGEFQVMFQREARRWRDLERRKWKRVQEQHKLKREEMEARFRERVQQSLRPGFGNRPHGVRNQCLMVDQGPELDLDVVDQPMKSTSVEFRCDDGLDIQSPAATSPSMLPEIRPSSTESALHPILDAKTVLNENARMSTDIGLDRLLRSSFRAAKAT